MGVAARDLVTVREVETPTSPPPHRRPTLYVPGGVEAGTWKVTWKVTWKAPMAFREACGPTPRDDVPR
jgi:hypothetical protein